MTDTSQAPSQPIPPRTPYEESIVAIWRDVLGRSDVSVFDDFFDLNGHSLLAIRVVARIGKTLGVDILVRDFFESPTVAALAAAVAARSSIERPMVGPRPPDAEPVLSFDQQRIWLESQLLPPAAYHVHGRRRLVGPLDVAAFEASIRAMLVRHEALRTRFPAVNGQPVQVVDDPDERWRLSVEDLSGAGGDPAGVARRLMDEQATAPFDLTRGPLFRCLLIRLGDSEHLLSVTMHHIVSDAWSIGLFVRELSALYRAGGDLDRAGLPAIPVQYRDYAVWQRGRLVGEALRSQVDYWLRHLDGAPPALALPAAQRSPAPGASGGRVRLALSGEETAALHGLCRKHGVTSFMVLLAGLATVLGRWSGQRDVVVGVPIASRTAAETEALIGFFVNTLPLRVDLSGEPAFADLLGRVRQVALGGYAHADAPFDVVAKQMQTAPNPRRTPLIQVMLNVIGSPEAERISGLEVEALETPLLPSKFDLVFTAQESHGALQIELSYNADRYQAAMMRTLTEHLGALLRAVVDDPTRGILDYPLSAVEPATGTGISPGERPAPAPHLAVERHARQPDRVAVIDREGEWSYRWLSQAADRVAEAVTRRGAPPTDHLGVVRRPTAAFAAAVLGCIKAGATFSVIEAPGPVPAGYLGVSTVLDASPPGEATPTGEAPEATIDLTALLAEPADRSRTDPPPADPDGATVTDAPDWAAERFGLGGDDRFAVLSGAPGHLLSALSSAWSAGATLVILEHPLTGDVGDLVAWLRRHAVSVLYTSPPVLRALAARAQDQLPALRYVVLDNGGEVLAHDVDAVRRLSPTSRCVVLYQVGRDGRPLAAYAAPDDWRLETAPLRVPLGTELPDTPLQLRHSGGQPAAVGEVAEICAGPDLTGDLGRRWADGTLEFVGKLGTDLAADPARTLDALRDLPEVGDAIVTEHVQPDGRTTLVGYVAGRGSGLDPARIRQHLLPRLADHLIPDRLLALDALPLTPDGDYDLPAHPSPDTDDSPLHGYVPPRTPMERQLVNILNELLTVDRIGVHDTFFELGGFSLLATQLTTRIPEEFGVELALRDVFTSPTVDALAQLIVRAQGELSGADQLEALLNEIAPAGDAQP